jgi:hypothetical protein
LDLEGLIKNTSSKGTEYYTDKFDVVIAKQCRTCCEIKYIEDYTKNKTKWDGRSSECKMCRKRYAQDNHEIESSRYRRWYEENRNHKASYKQDWQRNNLDKRAVSRLRRRARENELPNDFTHEQMKNTIEYFRGCALTGDSKDIQWDHVIPITSGYGGTTFGNMVPLRKDLNISKSNRNIFEWYSANCERLCIDHNRFNNLIAWLAEVNSMTIEEYRNHVYDCYAKSDEINGEEIN